MARSTWTIHLLPFFYTFSNRLIVSLITTQERSQKMFGPTKTNSTEKQDQCHQELLVLPSVLSSRFYRPWFSRGLYQITTSFTSPKNNDWCQSYRQGLHCVIPYCTVWFFKSSICSFLFIVAISYCNDRLCTYSAI